MYALAALVLIALCLAWTITQEPARETSWKKKKRASKVATVKPMPPLPEMTAPTVMPPTEVREAVSEKTPASGFTGFGGFGSVDGSGLGAGSGGSWLSGVQPL
jgi:hypothetical protein